MQTFSQCSFNGTINGTSFFLRSFINSLLLVLGLALSVGLGTASVGVGIFAAFITITISAFHLLATIWKRSCALAPNQPGLLFAGYIVAQFFVITGWIMWLVFIFMNSKIETHNG